MLKSSEYCSTTKLKISCHRYHPSSKAHLFCLCQSLFAYYLTHLHPSLTQRTDTELTIFTWVSELFFIFWHSALYFTLVHSESSLKAKHFANETTGQSIAALKTLLIGKTTHHHSLAANRIIRLPSTLPSDLLPTSSGGLLLSHSITLSPMRFAFILLDLFLLSSAHFWQFCLLHGFRILRVFLPSQRLALAPTLHLVNQSFNILYHIGSLLYISPLPFVP